MEAEQATKMAPGAEVHGYRLERELGAGGFGRVYLAVRDGRRYALKFILLEHFGERARRELSLLLHFKHANVVRLVSHVEWPEEAPEYLVLVMEYVEGRPLDVWVRERGSDAREVAELVRALARALEAMHAVGLLHRDLKGANVLVREADGAPVLVDFGSGIAPWMTPVTHGGLPPGTLHYRSPQAVDFLLRDCEPGVRYPYAEADELFSVGVLLYVLLTDVHPFRGPDGLEVMRRILREPAQAPHERNARVPRALGALCLRLLEKEVEARLASARALGEALDAALAGADASWTVPLRDAPPPAPRQALVSSVPQPEPRPSRRRVPWAVLGLLAAGTAGSLLLGLLRRPEAASVSPPIALPQLQPTWEVGFFPEVAPPWKPPEADEDAEPEQAATVAPVTARHRKKGKDVKTEKKNAGRSVKGLSLGIAAATQVACAGGPQERPVAAMPPPPQECPRGFFEALTPLDTAIGDSFGAAAFSEETADKRKPIPVKEGEVTLVNLRPWRNMPRDTQFVGRLYFGKDRIYGRFIEARVPGLGTFPICMELEQEFKQGAEMEKGSTPDRVLIFPLLELRVVERFGYSPSWR